MLQDTRYFAQDKKYDPKRNQEFPDPKLCALETEF